MKLVCLAVAAGLACGVAMGQVSLTVIPLSGTGTMDVMALSGDGTRLLQQKHTDPPNIPGGVQEYWILSRAGGSVALQTSADTILFYCLNGAGDAAWGMGSIGSGALFERRAGSDAASASSYSRGQAFGTSDDEHAVVGWMRFGPSSSFNSYAFIMDYSSGGSAQALLPTAGFAQSRATGVSPGGGFVAGHSLNTDSLLLPTRWTSAGASLALEVPAGTTQGQAVSVSDTGVCVGWGGSYSQPRATVWDAAGAATLLPISTTYAKANDISGDGGVIGGTEVVTSSRGRAVVWIDGARRELAELLASNGVSMEGLDLQSAVGVSTDGRVVAGLGRYSVNGAPVGSRFAYFASIVPAPCAPDMGGAGGLPGQDGVLDNNDFIAFIDLFFAQDPRADMGSAGGLRGSDGAYDNNDFIAFISEFFNGCG